MRLLPAGRQSQGVRGEREGRDLTRFGNSKPCLRCLHALEAVGVHRVIFTSGERYAACHDAEPPAEQCIPCEVRTVGELVLEAGAEGHSSRGDCQIHDAARTPGCHASAAQAAAACFSTKSSAATRARPRMRV